MKIAIPTNDKKQLFKRSGRAEGFLVIDVSGSEYVIKGYRFNTHSHHHHHHGHDEESEHGHSHKEIVDALSDCSYLVVNVIGKHFLHDLQNAGIKVFQTDETTITGAVDDFRKNVLNKA